MTSPCNHKRALDVQDCGYQSIPTFTDKIMVSPCRQRPDTGLSCPLACHDKSNTICESCGLLGRGNEIVPAHHIQGLIDHNKIKSTHLQKVKNNPCHFPDCEKMTRGYYCAYHYRTVQNRKKTARKRGVDPTIEWLERQIDEKRRRKK